MTNLNQVSAGRFVPVVASRQRGKPVSIPLPMQVVEVVVVVEVCGNKWVVEVFAAVCCLKWSSAFPRRR